MGVTLVAAMVLAQAVVVVSVVGGGMHHDLTLQRIDTQRAFYMAEAGAAMALREAWLNTDEDGDGTIGGISNDGDPSNDPTLGGASVSVEAGEDSGTLRLVATGRAAEARRRVEVRVESP